METNLQEQTRINIIVELTFPIDNNITKEKCSLKLLFFQKKTEQKKSF
jgi:hypothetical protein